MTRSKFAVRGFLLAIAAAALVPSAAAAQVCQPHSAEHAFEELLDVAPDDTPLEDKAWRISD